jgi:hypothetical protein
VYYQFGDTFCKNLDNEFVGLVSNTIAVLTTTKGPLYSKYEDVAPNGLVDQFIPYNLQDLKFNDEHESSKARMTVWGFGGIVEVSPSVGVLWYERTEAVSSISRHCNTIANFRSIRGTCSPTGVLGLHEFRSKKSSQVNSAQSVIYFMIKYLE